MPILKDGMDNTEAKESLANWQVGEGRFAFRREEKRGLIGRKADSWTVEPLLSNELEVALGDAAARRRLNNQITWHQCCILIGPNKQYNPVLNLNKWMNKIDNSEAINVMYFKSLYKFLSQMSSVYEIIIKKKKNG